MSILFRAQNLACWRNQRLIFKGFELAAAAGEAVVVEGPNGSGKSSLLRLLAGLASAYAGKILWQNRAINDDLTVYHQRLHYLGHLDGVKPVLSVSEQLAWWCRLGGVTDRSLVIPALEIFGLAAFGDEKVRFLSAGQRRRLSLARLIAIPRSLWLLDEPTVGLDAENFAVFAAALTAHLNHDGIAVIASHVKLGIEPHQHLHLTQNNADAFSRT